MHSLECTKWSSFSEINVAMLKNKHVVFQIRKDHSNTCSYSSNNLFIFYNISYYNYSTALQ